MREKHLLGVAIVVSVVTAGCSTSGAYLQPEDEQKIEQTVTSAEQLEKALGIPSLTVPRDDGKVMWVYQGIHKSAGPTTFLPYVNLVVGYNNKHCTRLTVLVDRETGQLSDWQYASAKGTEFWATTNDRCDPPQSGTVAPAR